jgi:hypothetical protein
MASSNPYPWERPVEAHPWERPFLLNSDDEGDEDPLNPWPDAAADALADYLIDLNLKQILSAKHTCTLAWWAWKAGLGIALAAIAMPPTSPSGHYQRKLDSALGFGSILKQQSYFAEVPAHNKFDVSRALATIPVLLPHEQIRREVVEHPELKDKLQVLVRDRAFADNLFPIQSSGKSRRGLCSL